MPDPIIRTTNVAMLFKLETTENVDAAPTAADAFPFEEDGYSYNSPYTTEDSNEANGSLVAAAPLVVGQPAEITIRCRLKGIGGQTAYSASVKPPHHALLSASGMRGLFTASIAAAALTEGSTTTATLGAAFPATAQALRGMPLVISGGPGNGQTPFITDYTAGKVATLSDTMPALTTATIAGIPENWTYAGTSPQDVAARAADHPSGTLYIYEDGTLLKFTGCRSTPQDIAVDTARPGFVTFKLMGVFAGKSDAAIPSNLAAPGHSAPILAQGLGGLDPAFLVNRLPLPIATLTVRLESALESPDDPNTAYGFSAAQIGERSPMLTCNPLGTTVAVRNTLSQIAAYSQYTGVIRCGSAVRNRWAITLPVLQPVESAPGTRGQFRSEDLSLRILAPSSRDAQSRDNELVLCFW
jgi:hypothetical protein